MKVVIVGITGGTGARVARLLRARNVEVSGLYRKIEQRTKLDDLGISGVLGDIVSVDVAQLAGYVRGSDLLVFSAGAGSADDDSTTDAIDGDGVTKSIAAAKLAGVDRLLLVSVFPEAGRGGKTDPGFEHYIEVKKRADVELAASDLGWIILRPSSLTDKQGVGTVSLAPAQFHTEISRDDLAETIVELALAEGLRRVILEVTEGSTPIRQAVEAHLRK